jgi:hypothetical protein
VIASVIDSPRDTSQNFAKFMKVAHVAPTSAPSAGLYIARLSAMRQVRSSNDKSLLL